MTPPPQAGGVPQGGGVPQAPPGVDSSTPTPARLYDYFPDGTNNFEADRALAERIRALVPEISDSVSANRAFHQRAARWMADRGIRQFLDLGSGLPTQGNTRELVQQAQPGAHVVYVDNDPMVLGHARSLLAGAQGARFIQADLRDTESVLFNPELRELIDFSEPVGLLITGVMYFVADESDPWGIVARFVAATPAGSYLALSHLTAGSKPPRAVQEGQDAYARATENLHFRSRAQVARFFDGLQIVPAHPGADPAVSYVGEWGAEDLSLADGDDSRWLYCAVARRP